MRLVAHSARARGTRKSFYLCTHLVRRRRTHTSPTHEKTESSIDMAWTFFFDGWKTTLHFFFNLDDILILLYEILCDMFSKSGGSNPARCFFLLLLLRAATDVHVFVADNNSKKGLFIWKRIIYSQLTFDRWRVLLLVVVIVFCSNCDGVIRTYIRRIRTWLRN